MSRLYVSCGQIRKEIPTGRPRLMRSVGLSGQARLDAGENVVLIDLLRFEDDPQDLMAIPGALRADPGKVRHRTRIVMPEGTGVSYMNYRRGPIGVVRVVSFYSCDLAAIEMQCDLNYRQSLRSREPSCAGPRCHCIPTVLFR